jgi:hypothetical protein
MPYNINQIELDKNETITGSITDSNIHYFVLEGKCNMTTVYNNDKMNVTVDAFKTYDIKSNVWVEISNPYDAVCKLLKINFF